MRFNNQVVVITGASSGIGKALAREFAREGALVALLARRKEKLDQIVDSLKAEGHPALALECDVRNLASVELAIRATLAEWGRIDGVVANAGYSVSGRIEKLSTEDFKQQFETNLFGVINTVQATINEIKARRGFIGIVGSVCSYVSIPGVAPYCMSKHALVPLAEILRIEVKRDGVGVSLISPGFVESEIRKLDHSDDARRAAKDPVPNWLILSSNKAARVIVRGLYKRKREIVVTTHAKVILKIQQLAPNLIRMILGSGYKHRRGLT